MQDQEIVLNLWYLTDESGAIYALRARCYIGTGTDAEKTAVLRERSGVDYLIAEPFDVPSRFHVTVVNDDGENTIVPVALKHALEPLGGMGVLFEDIFTAMQARLPAQTNLNISSNPLCVTTALLVDDEYNITPVLRK